MRTVAALLLGAAALVAAQDSAPEALPAQLLRFEAFTAKEHDISVFKWRVLAGAVARTPQLPEELAASTNALVGACEPDAERLCQAGFGMAADGVEDRWGTVTAAMNCLHEHFSRVSVPCVSAAHGAAEAVAASGAAAQGAVLAAAADEAMTAAATACSDAPALHMCAGGAPAPPAAPATPPSPPCRGRDCGRPNSRPWRVLRHARNAVRRTRAGGPPPPPPSPQQAVQWFELHSQLPHAASALGATTLEAAQCAVRVAGPPAHSSMLPWGGPPPGHSGDACVDAAQRWLEVATTGSAVARAAAASAAAEAAAVADERTAPSAGLRVEGWGIPGADAPAHGGPPAWWMPPAPPARGWAGSEEEDEEEDREWHEHGHGHGVWLLIAAPLLLFCCVRRCRRRAARRAAAAAGAEVTHPVPSPQQAAAAAAATAASVPPVARYDYGAAPRVPPPVPGTVPGHMYPDVPVPPAPRWSLRDFLGNGQPAGYGPVTTREY